MYTVQSSIYQRTPVLPLEGCLNFRDLGGYPVTGGWYTVSGRVYRADDLCRLTADDLIWLGRINLGCVIDLRQAHELAVRPHPLRGVPGVAYYNTSLNDALYADPAAPTHVPDSLYDMYVSLLAMAGRQLATVMRAIVRHRDRAVVFHCTAGKDRTGVVAALLLELAGVSRDLIAWDYAQSAENMAPVFRQITAEAAGQGYSLPDHLLESRAEDMLGFVDLLRTEYGGAEGYLARIGLDREEIDALHSILTGA